MVNVNHSKVQWGKASYSEVCELMDSVNLSFANSPLENKFLSQAAVFNESCVEALNRLDELDIYGMVIAVDENTGHTRGSSYGRNVNNSGTHGGAKRVSVPDFHPAVKGKPTEEELNEYAKKLAK